jgi:hypothetical protein
MSGNRLHVQFVPDSLTFWHLLLPIGPAILRPLLSSGQLEFAPKISGFAVFEVGVVPLASQKVRTASSYLGAAVALAISRQFQQCIC